MYVLFPFCANLFKFLALSLTSFNGIFRCCCFCDLQLLQHDAPCFNHFSCIVMWAIFLSFYLPPSLPCSRPLYISLSLSISISLAKQRKLIANIYDISKSLVYFTWFFVFCCLLCWTIKLFSMLNTSSYMVIMTLG